MSPRRPVDKNLAAWVQLYEARRATKTPQVRPVGRPPSMIPRKKVGVTLSKGEEAELGAWQKRFSSLMGRKVSVGETVGILTRILTARFDALGLDHETTLEELADFVRWLVEGEVK